jgi:predicted lipoprotein
MTPMRRFAPLFLALAAGAGICLLFPPVRLVPLRHQAAQTNAVFNAAAYAADFWSQRLLPALRDAPDAALLLSALASNAPAAAAAYGKTPGMSDAVYYLMQGTGTVCSVQPKAVGVALGQAGGEADLLLGTGMLFGNTVRDASGLLDASLFPNSQHFNDLSTELNRIVETRVISRLKAGAAPGRRLRFAAAAEVESGAEAERPLKVVPVEVEFEERP